MSIDPLEFNLYRIRHAILARRNSNKVGGEASHLFSLSLVSSDQEVDLLESQNLNHASPIELYHRTLARSVGTGLDQKEPKGPESHTSKPKPHSDTLIAPSRGEPDTKDKESEDKLSNTGRPAEARLQYPEAASPGLHRVSGTVPHLEPGSLRLRGFHQSKILKQVGAVILSAIRNLFRRPSQ